MWFGITVPGLLGLICSYCISDAPPPEQTPPTATSILGIEDIPNPSQTICGEIISWVDQGNVAFLASEAYECLLSVPFNSAVALRFLQYWNTTIQFQSTVPYLKSPPVGYMQPPVDIHAELDRIARNSIANAYKNQYEFEADLQEIVYAFHDGHVTLNAGILSAFTFASPYYITSVSIDGKQAPELYITDDILSHRDGYTISSIKAINGKDPVEYLTAFAVLNAVGNVEPHADWNQLMAYPAQHIQGLLNSFGGVATFYPGSKLEFEFQNGSLLSTEYLAFYNAVERTGPLSTPGDFYNYFVLGWIPDSCNPDCPLNPPPQVENPPSEQKRQNIDIPGENSLTSWFEDSYHAYPDNPDVVQQNLQVYSGGVVTGYFLRDTSTAVLSLPTFSQFNYDIGNFSQTVATFISGAKEAGMKRVIIDLQQNTGGAAFLAFDTFKQFFPQIEPFAGSRRRSQSMANALGTATSSYWESLNLDDPDSAYAHLALAADEWVITNRLNADTGEKFSSWEEYQGPRTFAEGQFTLTERYNLSDSEFSAAGFDNWLVSGYGEGNEFTTQQPFDHKDIVLLTDGLCSSACAIFLEMMTHQGGVRTIAVGGRPETGPMQAASGTRGARLYSADLLDIDFDYVINTLENESAASSLPTDRDPGIFTYFAGINLRDQIREGDDVPLQFKYLAADCRIYYSLDNAYNMTKLWLDAARATWDDQSFCVEESTGYSEYDGQPPVHQPPPPSNSIVENKITFADQTDEFIDIEAGIAASKPGLPVRPPVTPGQQPPRSSTTVMKFCTVGATCANSAHECVEVPVRCSARNQFYNSVMACLPRCNNRVANAGCSGGFDCTGAAQIQNKQKTDSANGVISLNSVFSGDSRAMLCFPRADAPALVTLGCPV